MDKKKALRILFYFALPIFLLLLSYQLTLLFYSQTENQKITVDYVKGNTPILPLNYTSSELSHLEDVKKVMAWTNIVYLLLLLFVTIYIILKIKDRSKEELISLLRTGGKVTLISIGIIIFLSLFFFNTLFTLFHQVFFPQGNWMFPPDSLLIQTFPLTFFTHISLFIFAQTVLYGMIFIGVGYLIKRWWK